METLERIHFLSQANQLKPVRELVRDLADKQGCSKENLECMVMAINEACMNIIQHAYSGREDGEIVLELLKYGKELIIRIYDFAETVDKKTIKSRDLNDIRPGGLGVHLINKVMDRVEYMDGPDGIGNLLEMRKEMGVSNICDQEFKEE